MSTRALESELAEFTRKYTPEIAAALSACRTKVRALFPRGYELVYDNYNALVLGFAPSQRASDAVLSVAAYPRWVTVFFLRGATLPDPASLLRGKGKQVRSVVLESPEDLDAPAMRALIAAAVRPVASAFASAPPLTTIVKSISAKQRPRRPPAASARRAAPSRSPRKRS